MKALLPLIAVSAFAAVASTPTAVAQVEVGRDVAQGLPWSVAAPERTSWTLLCRFRPVTSQKIWGNTLNREGRGPGRGRLPGQDGRCTLTLAKGAGPVGVALVKNGVATAAGTNDPATPAYINVF